MLMPRTRLTLISINCVSHVLTISVYGSSGFSTFPLLTKTEMAVAATRLETCSSWLDSVCSDIGKSWQQVATASTNWDQIVSSIYVSP